MIRRFNAMRRRRCACEARKRGVVFSHMRVRAFYSRPRVVVVVVVVAMMVAMMVDASYQYFRDASNAPHRH
jgi:hypothetical protein